MPLAPLTLPDAEVSLDPQWLPADEADALFAALRVTLPWQVHRVRLFGREYPAPRLSCWMGDAGASYRYSGVRHEPAPWPDALAVLRERRELGPAPVIASLSLGATRRFVLRDRPSGQKHAIELTHGSLLVMAGATQRRWQHALPRTARQVGERINLTFRVVAPLR